MATLVLGAVGRVFGGPLGGIAGSLVGGVVDRGLFGGGDARAIGRIADLAVQSAAYGEPIPIIVGRMRVAGNLVWTSGIKEASTRSGGGKRGGPATDTYSYSASFAVALAGRAIAGVGRVWADGRLIRDADGVFLSPVTMRVHGGAEDQAVDPLIAAAEAVGGAPAYRGIAYAVFEDLPLADYGNRIPNLTFEVIADDGLSLDVGGVIAALAMGEGRTVAGVTGGFPALGGYCAARAGSVGEAIAPLLGLTAAAVIDADGLVFLGVRDTAKPVLADDGNAAVPGGGQGRERRRRLGGETRLQCVELGFHDVSRDFQPGLQRVRQGVGGTTKAVAVAATMTPAEAKTLATAMLGRDNAGLLRASLRLPWRWLGLQPGDRIIVSGDPVVWQITEARFENFVVALDLVRVETMPPVAVGGDGGRALAFDDRAAGPTLLRVLDLPPLAGDLVAAPRLWAAAAGVSPGWRRAAIEVSLDNGASYAVAGVIAGGAMLGVAVSVLAPVAQSGSWDRFGAVEVELVNDTMWLEGRSETSVLAGSNLALLGGELIQFAGVEALGARRFRLSRLLRGRRGTEAAIAGHRIGEDFILLEPGGLLAIDVPVEALGASLKVRPAGVGDLGAVAVEVVAAGRNLVPLAPVHLVLREADGAVAARWVRRSRTGFGWPDFVDVPLAEASEAYLVEVMLDGRMVRRVTATAAEHVYSAADRLADGGGAMVSLRVAQLSSVAGPGPAAAASLELNGVRGDSR